MRGSSETFSMRRLISNSSKNPSSRLKSGFSRDSFPPSLSISLFLLFSRCLPFIWGTSSGMMINPSRVAIVAAVTGNCRGRWRRGFPHRGVISRGREPVDCIFGVSGGSLSLLVTTSNLPSQSPNETRSSYLSSLSWSSYPTRPCRSALFSESLFPGSGQLSRPTPGERLRRGEFRETRLPL